MVPVVAAPEPADFDVRVRQPGGDWIVTQGLDPKLPVPAGLNVRDYWLRCADQLWQAYNGVCAYSCILIRRGAANPAVEHFAPKSRRLDLAFEWSNYRLACLSVNSKKNNFEDVLDPFLIPPDLFFIEFAAGRIYVNPAIAEPLAGRAAQTIKRLGLDSPRFRNDRTFDYERWNQGEWSDAFMQKRSPFVWSEILRQGLQRRIPFAGVPATLS